MIKYDEIDDMTKNSNNMLLFIGDLLDSLLLSQTEKA